MNKGRKGQRALKSKGDFLGGTSDVILIFCLYPWNGLGGGGRGWLWVLARSCRYSLRNGHEVAPECTGYAWCVVQGWELEVLVRQA